MPSTPSREAFLKAQQTRFDEFVTRKTRAATAAVLPPLATDLDRASGTLQEVGSTWYEGLSRVAADAVLAGAGTILGEDIVFAVWHPELVRLRAELGKPRYPAQIVATLEGLDLDTLLLFNVPDIPVFVITMAEGARRMRAGLAERPWVTPIVMAHTGDLGSAFDILGAAGIRRISCVGGRRLATQIINAGLAQDLYLTTSPNPGGEPDTPFYPGSLPVRTVVRKHGTGPETGVIFEHHLL